MSSATLLIAAALAVAYANGANANFKGVASLFGSGTAGYWTSVRWAALTTGAGCLTGLLLPGVMLQAFSGKGLVPDSLVAQPAFLLSVGAGAAVANLLATRLGFPVSTTHMLMGGLLSARQVADTLAHKITGMNPGQGFAANLATALLTTTASLHGLPVSTTHVSVGALLGIGVTTHQARWKTAVPVLLAWGITLPCSALLAAFFWSLSTALASSPA